MRQRSHERSNAANCRTNSIRTGVGRLLLASSYISRYASRGFDVSTVSVAWIVRKHAAPVYGFVVAANMANRRARC